MSRSRQEEDQPVELVIVSDPPKPTTSSSASPLHDAQCGPSSPSRGPSHPNSVHEQWDPATKDTQRFSPSEPLAPSSTASPAPTTGRTHSSHVLLDGPARTALNRAYIPHVLQLCFAVVAAVAGNATFMMNIPVSISAFVVGTTGMLGLRQLRLSSNWGTSSCCTLLTTLTVLHGLALFFTVVATFWSSLIGFVYLETDHGWEKAQETHKYAALGLFLFGAVGSIICSIISIIFVRRAVPRLNRLVARGPSTFATSETMGQSWSALETQVRSSCRVLRRQGLLLVVLSVVLVAMFSGSLFVSIFSGLFCLITGVVTMATFWHTDELLRFPEEEHGASLQHFAKDPNSTPTAPGLMTIILLGTTQLFLLATVEASSWSTHRSLDNFRREGDGPAMGSYRVISPIATGCSVAVFWITLWVAHHVVAARAALYNLLALTVIRMSEGTRGAAAGTAVSSGTAVAAIGSPLQPNSDEPHHAATVVVVEGEAVTN